MDAPLIKKATLVFLLKDEAILLAMKKRGMGKGWWNGPGGKVEEGEDLESCARREVQEELGMMVHDLELVAKLEFIFVDEENWEMHVWVYLSREWEGEPQESEELAPQWFGQDAIPYAEMWDTDEHWLPPLLEGRKLNGTFWIGADNKTTKFELKPFAP